MSVEVVAAALGVGMFLAAVGGFFIGFSSARARREEPVRGPEPERLTPYQTAMLARAEDTLRQVALEQQIMADPGPGEGAYEQRMRPPQRPWPFIRPVLGRDEEPPSV